MAYCIWWVICECTFVASWPSQNLLLAHHTKIHTLAYPIDSWDLFLCGHNDNIDSSIEVAHTKVFLIAHCKTLHHWYPPFSPLSDTQDFHITAKWPEYFWNWLKRSIYIFTSHQKIFSRIAYYGIETCCPFLNIRIPWTESSTIRNPWYLFQEC